MTAGRAIPLVDISDTDGLSFQVESACKDIGFMYVSGHGVAAETIAEARQSVIDYFAQSEASRRRDQITQNNYRGYIPVGFFNANTGDGAADNYEGYKLHFEVATDDPIREKCDLTGHGFLESGDSADLNRSVADNLAAHYPGDLFYTVGRHLLYRSVVASIPEFRGILYPDISKSKPYYAQLPTYIAVSYCVLSICVSSLAMMISVMSISLSAYTITP